MLALSFADSNTTTRLLVSVKRSNLEPREALTRIKHQGSHPSHFLPLQNLALAQEQEKIYWLIKSLSHLYPV